LSSFRTWPEVGEHEISFKATNANGELVSAWTCTAKVAAEPVNRKTVKKGKKLTFSAPAGYTQVTWKYDGKVLSDETVERTGKSSQTIKFKSKGTHTVTCHAQGMENGNFRVITWVVNVK
jgi:plastocyanin